ncbi:MULTISPECIES: SDR family oxidoreductase [Cupriavidus]|uniref:SDR family NAD(P)-dependent oxidoreductase n=1 Tax=Cupriavidus oxalaticus TaxID=96344 RepID=A0A4P7L9R2_9BURK|nr:MULTISPECIES: SDR family oxidoreductase [Cupriavidus]MBF6990352.1 SDR family oxidoreductase [Cupriavidus sp. IK-TO18]QBY50609.1 SDR family NAD(P)-dependent oxidoreductase [Cupriavidus oxalaticus]TDF64250.1 SDR family NAD(P)-dependent oxidoreductase [Cupriavidus sp. L7L]
MKPTLKKIGSQVIVLTGATSGVGLVTARKAAARGARLVLVARSEDSLHKLAEELRQQGAEVITVAADVGRHEEVGKVAQAAIERFGGFDTWINNAGVTIFGRHGDVPLEDQRRLFDTNYWGTVHGSLAAAAHLRECGGAIINMGSEASDGPLPLQSAYAASQHAIKGFTDSLRLELEQEQAPVSITLIKPAGLETPLAMHAKNFLDVEPRLPPPLYDPALAADAILFAAENPRRDLFVGGAAKAFSAAAYHTPHTFDRFMRRFMGRAQQTRHPAGPLEDNTLYGSGSGLQERSGTRTALQSCPYTTTARHPVLATALIVGASAALAAVVQARRGR